MQYCVNVTDLIVFILYLCNYNGANCIALNSGSLSCDQSFGFQEKKSGLCNWNMALFSMGDFFILSEICMLNSRKTQDLVNGNSRNELCQRSNELWNTRKMFFRNEIKKNEIFQWWIPFKCLVYSSNSIKFHFFSLTWLWNNELQIENAW